MGPRLFREFRSVEADNPVEEALALIIAGDALDPDYSTLLPGGAADAWRSGGTDEAIGVDLPDADWTDDRRG